MKQLINICDVLCQKMNIRKHWRIYFLAALSVVSLLTFILMLICGIPSLPNANDLDNGLALHEALKTTNGFFAKFCLAIEMAAKNALDIYLTWGGNYSNPFFTTLEPFIFGSQYGFLHTVILLCFNSIGWFVFLKIMLVDVLGVKKLNYWLIALLVWNLNVQFIPSTYSAFYWYNGSFYNTVLYSGGLVLFALFFKLLSKSSSKNTVGFMILLTIMTIIIGGGNYTTILLLLLVLPLLLWDVWKDTNIYSVRKWQALGLFILLLICFLINVFAPGNAIRAQSYEQRNPIIAILMCFVYALRHLFTYLDLGILLVAFIAALILYMDIRKKNYSYKSPLLVLFVSFCLFASTYVSVSYAEGGMPPLRQINIQYWFLVIMVIANMTYALGWLEKTYGEVFGTIKDKHLSAELCQKTSGTLLLLLFILTGILLWRPDDLTLAKAIKDTAIISEFKQELDARIEVLEDESVKTVEFEEFKNLPSLYEGCYDIVSKDDDEKLHWMNYVFCEYYHKDSVWIVDTLENDEE